MLGRGPGRPTRRARPSVCFGRHRPTVEDFRWMRSVRTPPRADTRPPAPDPRSCVSHHPPFKHAGRRSKPAGCLFPTSPRPFWSPYLAESTGQTLQNRHRDSYGLQGPGSPDGRPGPPPFWSPYPTEPAGQTLQNRHRDSYGLHQSPHPGGRDPHVAAHPHSGAHTCRNPPARPSRTVTATAMASTSPRTRAAGTPTWLPTRILEPIPGGTHRPDPPEPSTRQASPPGPLDREPAGLWSPYLAEPTGQTLQNHHRDSYGLHQPLHPATANATEALRPGRRRRGRRRTARRRSTAPVPWRPARG